MTDIRWTDKLSLDNQGNIRNFNGEIVNQMHQELINRISVNSYCAKPIDKERDNEHN